ncbi:MAG TPA: DUF6364 family protein [Terriglobales bacterium]|jgi:plasmid stability protein
MKNITLAIEEEVITAGRAYAARHNTTLNQLVRDLLEKTVMPDRRAAAEEMLRVLNGISGHSRGWKWNREEAHERRG